MRLFVIGATGGIGRVLLAQAKERGHHVTAFVRSPEKLKGLAGSGATVRRGNPLDANDLRAALANHDVVLSALGAPGIGHTAVHQDGARCAVSAMRALGIRRLLIVSAGMLFNDSGPLAVLLRGTILRNIARDSAEMERIVTTSDLDWTVVRPPRLINGPLTKRYIVADGQVPSRTRGWISRSDVAHFLLDEAEQGSHVHRIVGIGSCR